MFLSAFNVFYDHHCGSECIIKNAAGQKTYSLPQIIRQMFSLPGHSTPKLNKILFAVQPPIAFATSTVYLLADKAGLATILF